MCTRDTVSHDSGPLAAVHDKMKVAVGRGGSRIPHGRDDTRRVSIAFVLRGIYSLVILCCFPSTSIVASAICYSISLCQSLPIIPRASREFFMVGFFTLMRPENQSDESRGTLCHDTKWNSANAANANSETREMPAKYLKTAGFYFINPSAPVCCERSREIGARRKLSKFPRREIPCDLLREV